jgi:putative acyl-CoA dehydrogenase
MVPPPTKTKTMATTRMISKTTRSHSVSIKTFSSYATHEVFNQQAPLMGGYNLYSSDRGLMEAMSRYGGDWHREGLMKHGELVGSERTMMFGDLANKNPPMLRTHDANGRRIDRAEYHPYYHELMNIAVTHQVTSLAWNQPEGTPGAHVARAGLAYMQNQADAGHCCPITMTYAGVAALRAYQDQLPLLGEWSKKLTSTSYDPSDARIEDKTGAILGMSMTEKQGGSDVQTNTTTAVDQGNGMYALTGHKWFTSAPNWYDFRFY